MYHHSIAPEHNHRPPAVRTGAASVLVLCMSGNHRVNPQRTAEPLGESLHCALLLDYVPPEEPPSTPLGNALRIR